MQRIVQRLCPGGRLLRAWPLTGGVSAQITALEIERSGGDLRRLVVRRHGAGDLAVNPDVAADEAGLLALLADAGLPVPRVHLLDVSGAILPTPYLVIDFIEGDWRADPPEPARAQQVAALLRRVHGFRADDPRLAFLRRRDPLCRAELDSESAAAEDADLEARLRAALRPHWPLASGAPSVLLHGDFWPGNLLWREGRVAALLDWEDAGLGDPRLDLAHARLELLWAWGAEAAERFTRSYGASPDGGQGPLYDLWAALRALLRLPGWGLPPAERAAKRAGLAGFVEPALARL